MERETELERRLCAVESQEGQGSAFDAQSWAWLVFLGVILPVCLLVWGWM